MVSCVFLALALVLKYTFTIRTTRARRGPTSVPNLAFSRDVSLSCTGRFGISCCGSNCTLLAVSRRKRFLMIPRNGGTPRKLSPSVTILRRPVGGVCLMTASTVSLFHTVSKVSDVGLSKAGRSK